MGLLFAGADYFVLGLYGPQWTQAIPPLKVLAIAGFFRMTYHVGGVVAQATGNIFAEFRRQGVYALLVLGGSFAGSRWGLQGVAAGVGVAIVAMYLMMGSLSISIVGASWRHFIVSQLPGILVGVVVAACCTLARLALSSVPVSNIVGMLILPVVALVSATAAIYAMPRTLRPNDLFGRLHDVSNTMPFTARRILQAVIRHPVPPHHG